MFVLFKQGPNTHGDLERGERRRKAGKERQSTLQTIECVGQRSLRKNDFFFILLILRIRSFVRSLKRGRRGR